MVKVSTKPAALLVALFLSGATAYGQTSVWPLKGEIDLSSGYGDLRSGRFHVGLDLRTGGKIGAKVFAPVDGYVWRVKMSYLGYGKGLYLKSNDGHIFVFGHLSGFNDAIAKAVESEQYRVERYFVDITFPRDSLPVKKGDLIAYSGQTGVGAPHLHFEERTPDNLPVNPLKHGFEMEDKISPIFERIGFQLVDDQSLFPGGERTLFATTRRIAAGKYTIDRVVAIDAPFGFLIDGYDQMRAGGMKQSINHLALFIDSVPFYESTFDTLPFEIGTAVELVFDPFDAANGEKRIRRAYRPVPEELVWDEARSAYGGKSPGSCAYGVDSPPRVGRHKVLVVGEDVSGNRSELRFEFEYVESGSMKSAAQRPNFQFAETEKPVVTEFRIVEDGVICKARLGTISRYWFFKPSPPYAPFMNERDRLFYDLAAGLREQGIVIDVAGVNDSTVVSSIDGLFTIKIDPGALFETQFVSVSQVDPPKRSSWQFKSHLYLVKPPTALLKASLGVSILLDSTVRADRRAGLCWCGEIGDSWVWIGRGGRGDSLAQGKTSGGGLFAVLTDDTPPSVTGVNLQAGRKYPGRRPEVSFTLRDDLSGIEDDKSIDVRIDGNWLLPELDMETGRCVATLREPIGYSRHTATITAVDRAGNKTERKIEFETVKSGKQ